MGTEKNKVTMESSAKRVDSKEKTEFEKENAKITQQMKDKEASVKEAQKKEEENRRKAAEEAAEKKKKEAEAKAKAEKDDSSSELVKGAASLATAAISSAASGKKAKGFWKGTIIGLVAGVALTLIAQTVLGIGSIGSSLTQQVNDGKESADEVIDETFLGYTSADFQDVILGSSTAKQDLEVLEQAVIVDTTITKAGLGNLSIFSKTKQCEFAGSGIYTIDMGKMDKDHITYDADARTVTVKIPHAVLAHVILDEANTTFQDTEKGLLAFGDLALTQEQQNELQTSIKAKMSEELGKQDLMDMADDFGKKKVWQILDPLVSTVNEGVSLSVEFE